jgi:hypothetical protein
MRWPGFKRFLHPFVDAIGNRLYMRVGIAFTDDKKVCRCVEFPKIQLDDIFAFFITDPFDDEVIELFELRLFGPQIGSTYQISFLF